MLAIKYKQSWEKRRVRIPTPLNAKRLLLELGTNQAELSRSLSIVKGERAKETMIAQILNRNIWPIRDSKDFLQSQINDFIKQNGATEEELETAFDLDKTPGMPRRVSRQEQTGEATRSPIDDELHLPEVQMLSQNAKKHFSLFRDPFVNDVESADDVFLSADQRYIREAMFQTAKLGGFIAVIGESGAGKTTLRKDLLDRIQREKMPISAIQPRIIDKGRLTAGAICDAVIGDISQEWPKRSLEAKARQIERLLTGSSRAGNAHVLIIEEAHDLSVQTLKYLKRFWELEDGFKKLLAIILVGQPELKNKLDERQNWEAREVIRRCEIAELLPLNGNLNDYLELKFKRIGKAVDEVFEPEVYDALRQRLTLQRRGSGEDTSMLYPLVVNNAITKAMNLAADIGLPKVNAEIIKEV